MTNPRFSKVTLEQAGSNLFQGFLNFLEDWERAISGKGPVGAGQQVQGQDVASTDGFVIYRNELIQYSPRTSEVQAEPIVIVPTWIMKYYILDLSAHYSLVRYLVQQGFTEFMISWRNPNAAQRDLGMKAYLNMGVMAAMDAVAKVVRAKRIHSAGYSIGGTLMTIAATEMARNHSERPATLKLFATQTGFTQAGELMLFISESQVAFLENIMWDQGYLNTKQRAGAFQLLHSSDLIWSCYVQEYLLGRRQDMFDLMAWNADAIHMLHRVHSQYLRQIFLNNELAQGRYRVDGKPVAIDDIAAPILCVSIESDHVAPWRSVHKLNSLADTDITFVLTNSGHNAGIFSEPGHPIRHFRINTTYEADPDAGPDAWYEEAAKQNG